MTQRDGGSDVEVSRKWIWREREKFSLNLFTSLGIFGHEFRGKETVFWGTYLMNSIITFTKVKPCTGQNTHTHTPWTVLVLYERAIA